MKYWLFKTEPATFGVDDLARAKDATTAWDGVRNYQVRNMLRDEMRIGDQGFLYHSSCDVPGIHGVVRVVRAGYPEQAALDRKHAYFDPQSDPRTRAGTASTCDSSDGSSRRSRSEPCANMRTERSRSC